MAKKKTADSSDQDQPLQVGDLVRIRNSSYKRARVIELRGPLGPGGAHVYRVRVPQKPKPFIVEVLADQLVRIEPVEPTPEE